MFVSLFVPIQSSNASSSMYMDDGDVKNRGSIQFKKNAGAYEQEERNG
jgi:hypothetical protein